MEEAGTLLGCEMHAAIFQKEISFSKGKHEVVLGVKVVSGSLKFT